MAYGGLTREYYKQQLGLQDRDFIRHATAYVELSVAAETLKIFQVADPRSAKNNYRVWTAHWTKLQFPGDAFVIGTPCFVNGYEDGSFSGEEETQCAGNIVVIGRGGAPLYQVALKAQVGTPRFFYRVSCVY